MRLLILILPIFLFYGCKKDKLKAPPVFFVQPQTIAVSSSSLQGSSSHKITDLWYYVNNQFKGAIPAGNILPVPSSGSTQIKIFPGIKNNGISATRIPYPFYEPIEIDTTVENGITINRNFYFNYKSGTVFHWIENFEGFGSSSGVTITKANDSDTMFAILDKVVNPFADVFEGNKCLYFGLDDTRRNAHFNSAALYNLPKSGAPVYLEINYKCNQPFSVGIYNGLYTYVVAAINTSENWNKIYIQLSSGVGNNTSTLSGLFISAIKQTDHPEFYIDNLKIVSF